MHRLRKVPQRVAREPCSMLHGLCLPSLPTPRCAPSLSLSSLSLRLCSGGAPLPPPVDFYVMVYLPLSWCSGSKNPQGRLRRKQRAVVPNVDFTSSAVCRLESTRDGSSKMALPLKKFYSCYTFGCCGRRRRREMMTLQCIAAKDRAQTT